MKRYHPYYLLDSSDPAVHHFEVYSPKFKFFFDCFGWDEDMPTIKDFGGPFGFEHGLPETQQPIPDILLPIVPELKKKFLAKHEKNGMQLEDILVRYDGYKSEKKIRCVIVTNHVDYPPDPKDDSVVEWSWEECFVSTLCVRVDKLGEVTPSSNAFCLSGTMHTSSEKKPLLVYDYLETRAVSADSPEEYLNEHFNLFYKWRDSPLLPLIKTTQVLNIHAFNEKYNLVPNFSLDNFKPRWEEWKIQNDYIDISNGLEKFLMSLLHDPQNYLYSDPWSWSSRNYKQVPHACAFLSRIPTALNIFKRSIISCSKYFLTQWEALVDLNPEFPSFVCWSKDGPSKRLPSAELRNQPTKFLWLMNAENRHLLQIMPKEEFIQARILAFGDATIYGTGQPEWILFMPSFDPEKVAKIFADFISE